MYVLRASPALCLNTWRRRNITHSRRESNIVVHFFKMYCSLQVFPWGSIYLGHYDFFPQLMCFIILQVLVEFIRLFPSKLHSQIGPFYCLKCQLVFCFPLSSWESASALGFIGLGPSTSPLYCPFVLFQTLLFGINCWALSTLSILCSRACLASLKFASSTSACKHK